MLRRLGFSFRPRASRAHDGMAEIGDIAPYRLLAHGRSRQGGRDLARRLGRRGEGGGGRGGGEGVHPRWHTRSEAAVNHSLGFLGWRVTEMATCGVQDRESNEIRNLKEATELIEEWQKQLQGGTASESSSH